MAGMGPVVNAFDWQIVAVTIIVGGAAAYLAWKVILSGRGTRPARKGPDVPAGNLVRRRPSRRPSPLGREGEAGPRLRD